MDKHSKIYVAGHRGMVGGALVRKLEADGYTNIITRSRAELDLTLQADVSAFYEAEQPDVVIVASAKVGGIHANSTYPAEFIYDNLMIECNLIHGAYKSGSERLLFLGSSCIYPRMANQPIQESELLTGSLEPTNEPYAVAKIAGIKLCESYNRQYGTDYRSVMPTSHVIPGLIRRFHEAKVAGAAEVAVWGTGKVMREFLFVDDLAAACVGVLELSKAAYDQHTQPTLSHINVGTGEDITIATLANTISNVVGFEGSVVFDTSKPDGPPRKLVDTSLLREFGVNQSRPLEQGLNESYQDFLSSEKVRAS